MSTPADKASRLLIGNGFALLLAFAFSLQMGRTSIQTISVGWLIGILSFIFLIAGFGMRSENSPFRNLFPDEDTVQTARRISEEMNEMSKQAKVSSAWAKLEVDLLEDEIGNSEE